MSPSPLTGAALIADEAKRLTDQPGVYRMMGDEGEVLYVGKAKSLKKRVIQYAQGRFHTNRIANMVALTRSMEFVTTKTETEALLLESNLIKQLKPRFNVLLRDDKSFPEIVIRRNHRAPQIRKHRGAHTIPGDYFGPFASTWAVNRTVNSLQKAFLLRSCSDSVFESRTRPCMLHQIKRCSAPCVDLISPPEYDALVEEAHDFLRGKSRAVMKRLADEMHRLAEDMEFERAARLRDRIRALSSVSLEQSINPSSTEEADVFALHEEGGQACVQVFFFRAGQNWGNKAYFPRVAGALDVEDGADELAAHLEAFIGQFYDAQPIPRLILVSHELPSKDLLCEAFAIKAGRRVDMMKPQRGEKCELVKHAMTNAREALGRKMAETGAQAKLLDGVCDVFGLESRPERIEVYDNSHIMGTNAVG
ncbi:MAG: excinuclease ABC subunit UvrC, partial [Caulobacteraceae bacterium]